MLCNTTFGNETAGNSYSKFNDDEKRLSYIEGQFTDLTTDFLLYMAYAYFVQAFFRLIVTLYEHIVQIKRQKAKDEANHPKEPVSQTVNTLNVGDNE